MISAADPTGAFGALPDGFCHDAFQAFGQAVIATDVDGRVQYWNPAAETLYGYPAGESVGQLLAALILPEAGTCAAATDRVDAGEPYAADWAVRDRAGRTFTAFVTSAAVVDLDGVVVGRLGVSVDVSERRRAEVRVRELAAIIDGSNDAIIETDLRGTVRHANPAVETLYGYPPLDLIGQDVKVLLSSKGDAETITAALRTALETGQVSGVVVAKLRRRDGSLVDVSLWISPVRDQAGTITGVVGIGSDVSAEVDTRTSLETSERRFRARFDQASIPQAMASMDGRLSQANDALGRLLGVSADQLAGVSLVEAATTTGGPGQVDARMAAVLAGDRDTDTWERVIIGADGRTIPVLVHAALLRDADGTAYGVAAFLQDLTDLRTAERALDQQAALSHAIARRASDWALVLDATGGAQYVSPAAAAALGYDLEAIDQRLFWNVVHHEDLPAVRRSFDAVAATTGSAETVQFRATSDSGGSRWLEEVFTNCVDDPDIAGIVCNGRDVTEQVRAARALEASEARYRAIAETAGEGIWAASLDGQTWYANHRVADILGVEVTAVYEGNVPALMDPDGVADVAGKLRRCHEHGRDEFEVSYTRPDGATRVLRSSVAPLRDDLGRTGSLAMISDITGARHAEAELRRRSLRDQLTGLANRTLMTDRFELALANRHLRGDGAVAIIVADLDQFKLVNDSWGHAAGDALLVQVATRFSAAVRGEDTVARSGGDEFVVVCDNVAPADAIELAHRLQDALADPFQVEGQRVYFTASFGVAVSPPHPAPDLVRFAEAAMYEAKSHGRGRIRVFDPALADVAADRLSLRNDLRDALRSDELDLVYQPVVNLLDGQIMSVEALARWRHPTRGPVSPVEFVAVAEANGLAPALDRWALGRACRDAERLSTVMAGPPRVAVNISARHLADPELEDRVRAAMRDTALADGGLILEITETAVMDDPEQAISFLHRMRSGGVEASIDDFGTGYSSLSYLKRLPVTTLKIDRSFINDITEDPEALAIASAVFNLAAIMRLNVIAEGIETIDQLRLLRSLGCTSGQGFLFSPGVAPQALIDTVARLPEGRFDVTVAELGPGGVAEPSGVGRSALILNR